MWLSVDWCEKKKTTTFFVWLNTVNAHVFFQMHLINKNALITLPKFQDLKRPFLPFAWNLENYFFLSSTRIYRFVGFHSFFLDSLRILSFVYIKWLILHSEELIFFLKKCGTVSKCDIIWKFRVHKVK